MLAYALIEFAISSSEAKISSILLTIRLCSDIGGKGNLMEDKEFPDKLWIPIPFL